MAVTEAEHGPKRDPITNTPLRKTTKTPLFFIRTVMLFLAWACTAVAIGLGFWAANTSNRNQEIIMAQFQGSTSAEVLVGIRPHIYTATVLTSTFMILLWIFLTVMLFLSFKWMYKPYQTYGGGWLCSVGVCLFIILISGAAETWYFERLRLIPVVIVDGVQIPQRQVESILADAGVSTRFRSSMQWRLAIGFYWITFIMTLAALIVLGVSDSEARASAYHNRNTTEALLPRGGAPYHDQEKGQLSQSMNLPAPPPPRSALRGSKTSLGLQAVDNEIVEVPVESAPGVLFDEKLEREKALGLEDVNLDDDDKSAVPNTIAMPPVDKTATSWNLTPGPKSP